MPASGANGDLKHISDVEPIRRLVMDSAAQMAEWLTEIKRRHEETRDDLGAVIYLTNLSLAAIERVGVLERELVDVRADLDRSRARRGGARPGDGKAG